MKTCTYQDILANMSSSQSQAPRISAPIINSALSKDQLIFQSLKNQCFKGTVKVIFHLLTLIQVHSNKDILGPPLPALQVPSQSGCGLGLHCMSLMTKLGEGVF